MAQAGCWVPAEFMALCPFVRLVGRLSTGDSIDTNSSSFMVEMQVGWGGGWRGCRRAMASAVARD
jgi:hypothetical protein